MTTQTRNPKSNIIPPLWLTHRYPHWHPQHHSPHLTHTKTQPTTSIRSFFGGVGNLPYVLNYMPKYYLIICWGQNLLKVSMIIKLNMNCNTTYSISSELKLCILHFSFVLNRLNTTLKFPCLKFIWSSVCSLQYNCNTRSSYSDVSGPNLYFYECTAMFGKC